MQVAQSFGNCPKYIRERHFAPSSRLPLETATRTAVRLDATTAAEIRQADTFFVASHHREPGEQLAYGADVSHRGGSPGFVRVDDEQTLTWPDYVGNSLFNTLGNLTANPRAGLLFPGFGSGNLLHLSGRATIVWEGPDVDSFPGAQRVVRFRIERTR